MKSNTANKKKINDKTLILVALIAAAILLIILWRVVAKPIINKTRYDGYLNDFTISLNNSIEENKPITVIMDGEEYEVDEYSRQTYYAYIVDIGMGMPIEGKAGDEVLTLKLPDGTTLDFRDGEITQGVRKGKTGAYIYYTGPRGKQYNYASDTVSLQAMKNVMKDQFVGEEYENKLRQEALEERAKEIEAKLEAEKNGEAQGEAVEENSEEKEN